MSGSCYTRESLKKVFGDGGNSLAERLILRGLVEDEGVPNEGKRKPRRRSQRPLGTRKENLYVMIMANHDI